MKGDRKNGLMVLESQLTMANLVHRDYDKEFASVGDTITIRKPAKFTVLKTKLCKCIYQPK